MSSLFIIHGRDQGRKFELAQDTVRLGRDNRNEINLNDGETSRIHAEIKRLGEERYQISDLGSSNGTFVNEKRSRNHHLRNGDRIRIGKTILIFTTSANSRGLDSADLVKIIQTPLPESASNIVSSIQADVPSSLSLHDSQQQVDLPNVNFDLVYHAALAVSQTLDIDQLIEKLMQMIFDAIAPDRGCILLLDQDTDEMVPRITRSQIKNEGNDQLQISRSIVDFVMESKQGVITSDAINDDRWDSQASILRMGVSEAICVPMQGRYGTQGVIYIDTRTSPGELVKRNVKSQFTDQHLKMMIAIGHQAALAIEDTNFYSAMIQSERMAVMGQTIAMLSHHIKNILQGINGGSYLIKEGIKKDELPVIESGWRIVEKNQAKISQLVLDMLSFSKDREPELTTGNINTVLDDVVELMQHRATENGVHLAWQPTPDLPPALFDSEAIHRAVLNVLSNGIDACQGVHEASVSLTAQLDQSRQRFEILISDNADGIPEENIEKVFGVFESGKGQRGTGLGLPVSRKIMQEHGGDITLKSKVGEGSQFCLHFPFQTQSTENGTIEIDTNPRQ